jgi:hypothetical protein
MSAIPSTSVLVDHPALMNDFRKLVDVYDKIKSLPVRWDRLHQYELPYWARFRLDAELEYAQTTQMNLSPDAPPIQRFVTTAKRFSLQDPLRFGYIGGLRVVTAVYLPVDMTFEFDFDRAHLILPDEHTNFASLLMQARTFDKEDVTTLRRHLLPSPPCSHPEWFPYGGSFIFHGTEYRRISLVFPFMVCDMFTWRRACLYPVDGLDDCYGFVEYCNISRLCEEYQTIKNCKHIGVISNSVVVSDDIDTNDFSGAYKHVSDVVFNGVPFFLGRAT